MMHDTLTLIAKSRSTGSPSSLFALDGELGEIPGAPPLYGGRDPGSSSPYGGVAAHYYPCLQTTIMNTDTTILSHLSPPFHNKKAKQT